MQNDAFSEEDNNKIIVNITNSSRYSKPQRKMQDRQGWELKHMIQRWD
jgi:hypothetical protein